MIGNIFKTLCLSVVFTSLTAITTLAGTWQQDTTGWKYLNNDNSKAINTWVNTDNTWYHFDNNGYMQTGWLEVDNNWYYLTSNGSLAVNTTIDKCKVGSDGAWIKDSESDTEKDPGSYLLGQTWTVKNQWTFTIDSVYVTDDRNEQTDANPDQVIVLNFSYKNLGYKDDYQNLYFSNLDMTVLDENGQEASTYPIELDNYGFSIKVGKKCEDAEEAFGLKDVSKKIKVIVKKYDNNFNLQSATFELNLD